ncbi:MAG: glycosyltransferase family 2 protein [Fimbriimonadaceae bacterium]|nr:glycosyltransferase family 2 protein [Fimbriimonadaceae bacterium]
MEGDAMPDVTIIVPALNEEDTISEVVQRLLELPMPAQIIVVNDGSTDATADRLAEFGDRITVITNPERGGKGRAIRTALAYALGRTVVVQDADLEYFPEDIPTLVAPILEARYRVVYGARFLKGMHPGMALPNKTVNVLLRWAVYLLFGRRINDEATCYKAFERTFLEDMDLQCERFEFCPEVTAKTFRMGEAILELPARYEPRTKQAGKKIRWTDAPEAFWTLLRWRLAPPPQERK